MMKKNMLNKFISELLCYTVKINTTLYIDSTSIKKNFLMQNLRPHQDLQNQNLHLTSTLLDSLVAQLVKNPPAMQQTPIWSLGWEDPLEKEQVAHSSILGLP